MSRLSAGAGYRYLLRDTCCVDAHRAAGASLTSYYTATGYPPGTWWGDGLGGLGVSATGRRVGRIRAGAVVTEDAMTAVYGAGRDPVTGEPLGAAFRQYKTLAHRVAAGIARLPASLTGADRDAAVRRIEAVETGRRTPVAVAGFDLTFTVPKSVSVLWALANPGTQAVIVAAHQAAVADALTLVQSRALFTRTGRDGCAQVTTTGMVAAGFAHPDTRAGDPNLHTHVVVANRVQTSDGAWRTVDSKALHHAAVAVSEYYDDLIADRLTAALGVGWQWRDRGPRRTAAHEITGIGEDLLAEFSTRSTRIEDATRDAITEFAEQRGRYPTRAETTRLRQRATLATRPVKTVRPLRELMRAWRDRASRRTGLRPEQLVSLALDHGPAAAPAAPPDGTGDANQASLSAGVGRGLGPMTAERAGAASDNANQLQGPASSPRAPHREPGTSSPRLEVPRHRQATPAVVDRLAAEVLARSMARRSTWTSWNLFAEAARVTRGLRLPDTRDRLELLDQVVAAATTRCESLDAPELVTVPAGYRRPDGTSVFTRDREQRLTHARVLDAETRLLAALDDDTAPAVSEATATRIATAPQQLTPSAAPVRLHPDQVEAVVAAATSGSRLQVLVGPAGTGKTTTLRALRHAWEARHGHGSVLGLASSATAAAELAAALGVECENTAKWLHESTGPGAARRTALIEHATSNSQPQDGRGPLRCRAHAAVARWRREQHRWSLHPGQLVIVDEASLAGTFTLDALLTQAHAAGAKLLLVGDHQQLSAVDAGGAFHLLATTPGARELTSLWRFRRRWEATASRRLRAGDPAVLATYSTHGRIHSGPGEAMLDAAYEAWASAEAAGRSALLLAADTHTVTALNTRAHHDRVTAGTVTGPAVPAAGGVLVAVGDRVVTRANDRTLPTPTGGFVRNGALWHVTATHADGALTLTPARHHQPRNPFVAPVGVVVPGDYVRANVELGYATTIHRAQGITVEQAHVLLTPGVSRQGLYVAMTRGRALNRVYVATDTPDPACDGVPDPGQVPTATDILETVLACDSAERSATETLRESQDHAGSLARLVPIRAGLLTDADTRRWTRDLPTCGLTLAQVTQLQASPAAGALHAALREVDTDGYDPVHVLRAVLAARSIDDADDLAAVLHERVTGWHQHQPACVADPDPVSHALRQLRIAPAVTDDSDPVSTALDEIDDLIRARIHALTIDDLDTRPSWMQPLGHTPTGDPGDARRWRDAIATIAAYRDLHHITSQRPVPDPERHGDRLTGQQHRLAVHAARTATRLGAPTRDGTPDRSVTP